MDVSDEHEENAASPPRHMGAVRQPSVAELADDSDEDTAEQRQQSVSDVERARSAWDSEQLEAAMASERRKQWKPFKLR